MNTVRERTPFFSIITVALNAEQYIGQTIASTLEQTFSDFEIIVKDGLSKDGTLAQIPEDARIRIYSEKDSSIYNAMNQAISYAKGKYLIFMNCGDVFYDSTVLDRVHNFIVETDCGKSGIVIGDCYSKGMYKCQNGCENRFKQYRCSGFSHQSMFIRRDVFMTLGVYDESFRMYADMEMFLRSFRSGNGIGYIPYPICDYMGGGFSDGKKAKKQLDDDKRRIRKRYFSTRERIKFFLLFHGTLPGVRNYLESDNAPEWIRQKYRRLSNRLNNLNN